jgi:hypothetical protein
MSHRPTAPTARSIPSEPPADLPPADVAEFIRFCHRRRHVGWPELYDDMCAVAARGEFKGWDSDQFAAHGLTFSLFEMTRLSGWVRAVLAAAPDPRDADERRPVAV